MNFPNTGLSAAGGFAASGIGSSKVLANGRVSRVDHLKAQPRKPGEASFFYADHHFQYDAVKVLPGEYYVSNEDLVVFSGMGERRFVIVEVKDVSDWWSPHWQAGGRLVGWD